MAFRLSERRRHPELEISRLNSPACTTPGRRFAAALTSGRRTARGHRVSLALRCRELASPSSMPVYPGAFSDFSRSSITGLRPRPSPHDPPLHHDRRVTVRSPGSQHEEITRMHGFFDPAGSADGSRKRRQRCCLPLIHSTSAPRHCLFRGSIAGLRAPRHQRFAAPSRDTNAWAGPSRFAKSSM